MLINFSTAHLKPTVSRLISILLVFALSACSANARAPIPAGVVPAAKAPLAADEKYGHEVYGSLSERYELSHNDDQIRRVNQIVDRLTAAAKADAQPWHVAVFDDDSFANAAATRVNYIFVWSGIIKATNNDAELAGVLAHEIGHTLAGHTAPTPAEEVRAILGDVLGRAAGEVANVRFPGSMAASLAETLVTGAYQALVVNPGEQVLELEADQIGLFLMADAGYDPQSMLDFWRRASTNPAFGSAMPEILSSHPATERRLDRLSALMPDAARRYQPVAPAPDSPPPDVGDANPWQSTLWTVESDWSSVFSRPDADSQVVIDLPQDTTIEARHYNSKWLEVTAPARGYVPAADLKQQQVQSER